MRNLDANVLTLLGEASLYASIVARGCPCLCGEKQVAKSVPPSLSPFLLFSPKDIPVESMKASLRSHHDIGDQTSEIVS